MRHSALGHRRFRCPLLLTIPPLPVAVRLAPARRGPVLRPRGAYPRLLGQLRTGLRAVESALVARTAHEEPPRASWQFAVNPAQLHGPRGNREKLDVRPVLCDQQPGVSHRGPAARPESSEWPTPGSRFFGPCPRSTPRRATARLPSHSPELGTPPEAPSARHRQRPRRSAQGGSRAAQPPSTARATLDAPEHSGTLPRDGLAPSGRHPDRGHWLP